MVVIIDSEILGQGTAVCFTDVTRRVISIHDLTHLRLDVLEHIVVQVQQVSLNGLCNVRTRREVAVREFCAGILS